MKSTSAIQKLLRRKMNPESSCPVIYLFHVKWLFTQNKVTCEDLMGAHLFKNITLFLEQF
jgi:hypothetical protein